MAVVTQTTSRRPEPIEPLFTGDDVRRFHAMVRQVPIAEDLVRYAVRLASASRPVKRASPDFVNQWVSWGAGLRAAQNLVLGGKARALLQGRSHVTLDDIRSPGSSHVSASHPDRLPSRSRGRLGGRRDRSPAENRYHPGANDVKFGQPPTALARRPLIARRNRSFELDRSPQR